MHEHPALFESLYYNISPETVFPQTFHTICDPLGRSSRLHGSISNWRDSRGFGARSYRKCQAKDAGGSVSFNAIRCARHHQLSGATSLHAYRLIRKKLTSNINLNLIDIITPRMQGFKGFYRGFCATLALEVPFGIVQFPVWEFSKQYLSYRLGKELTPWQAALCGSFAGTTAAVCTNPLDVAKTRQILDINGGKYADKSITSVLRSIAAKEGLPGLFSGLAPRVIWISMGGFIFFGAYSHLKKIMIERDSNAWNIEGF